MKRPIFLLISLVALAGAYFAYKSYNKPHTNVSSSEAIESMTAAQLFDKFSSDEAETMKNYSDKVIEVIGTIFLKDLSNKLEPQLVLEANGDNGYIRCGFKQEELVKIESLEESSTIKVKGICKGINGSEELDLLSDIDVVLSNCIIIE
ncbi:MAG: OB-fold protein [Bacteroidia bacterium]